MLISVLLVLLLFGVLQVGVYFYARNIVAASAADAARYAAAVGVPPSAGGARAEQLIADGLGAAQARAIKCTSRPGPTRDPACRSPPCTASGTCARCWSRPSLPLTVDFTSSALQEQAP